MCSTVERMDGCENSAEIIIVPLKERIAGINFFFGDKHTTAERITQTMNDCKFSCQSKYSTLYKMDNCHSFHDKNRQRMDGCNLSGEINRLPLKKSNA